uniref:Flagellar assembly protein FliH n=1 Tax=Desulfatirhabdium butyrativorans TaxID=340467 RepID=A0A7C4MLY2_9BACT
MDRIDPFTQTSRTEPYSFPDLKRSTGEGTGKGPTRSNAFQRQFSASLNDGNRFGQPGEVCPPPWGSVDLSKNRGPEDDHHPDSEAYREIIDRMIQQNEQQLKAAYAKGREEGRQEGLKLGLEQGRGEGIDIGKREGILQGRAEGEKRIAPIAGAFQEALDQLAVLRKAALHEARAEAVKLAFYIAERILGIHLRLHPDAMQHLVEKACVMAAPSRILRVKVHPDAVEYCQNHPSLLSMPEDVVFIPDPTLAYGGCVLETDTGEIDARLESQLQVLWEALERELELSRHVDPAESLTGMNADMDEG